MTIANGRSNPKRARVSRLSLAGTVLLFACSGNDLSSPRVPPPPVIDGIFPSAVVAGRADLTLTITGSNFVEGRAKGSHAMWVADNDTTLLATTFVSSSELTAVIPAALLSNSATAQVLLKSGDLMGDVPVLRSNAVGFAVTDTDPSRIGTIIVYGQTSALPPRAKGYREVSLDGGPWLGLSEGQSLSYSPVAAGVHRLAITNPCGFSHIPGTIDVTVSGGQTVTVTIDLGFDCS